MTDTTTDAPSPAPTPPNPAQDRSGLAMPPNIGQLLYVVATLLEYGRHLADTIERRAAMPGFSMFASLFGTAELRVIFAHLHRGIMRANALEALLFRRAATGRDVAVAPIRIPAAPRAAAIDDMLNEPFSSQIARLAAERAGFDAPLDPENLPTQEEIEAEVHRHSIGRSIAAICRDFGVVPGLCTGAFWTAILEAITFHAGNTITLLEDMQRKSERFEQEQEQDPALQELDACGPLDLRQALGFRLGEWPIVPFDDMPLLPEPCPDVPLPHAAAAVSIDATGPPPHVAATVAA